MLGPVFGRSNKPRCKRPLRILKTAAQGQRDRQRLRDAALVDLAA